MTRRIAAILVAAAAAITVANGQATPPIIEKHFTVADRKAGRYQYVPFEVPRGVRRLRITYAYGRAGGGNTLDLGLFEPGPLTFGSPAFRGWSGGERDTIVIGETGSSPGYRNGPVTAGQWNVALGLYRVVEAGVDVYVTVEFDPPLPPSAPTPVFPDGDRKAAERAATGLQRGEPRWWHGDLHVHTEHSDGKHSLRDVARLASATGLDFIIIADHNNTTHRRDLDQVAGAPLVISGEEVTTPGGHANLWGLGPEDWFDFRLLPGDPHLGEIVERAHARGALFSINHPFLSCDQCSWTHEVPSAIDALEVWNGPLGPQMDAVKMWDGLLNGGRHVTGVASSDWHRTPAPIGAGSVRVLAASLEQAPLLDAIRKGRVVMMRDAAAPAPRVEARAGRHRAGIGDTLELTAGQRVELSVGIDPFVSPGLAGCPAACRADLVVDGARVETQALSGGLAAFTIIPAHSGYLRVHITSGNATVAITNPIWLRIR